MFAAILFLIAFSKINLVIANKEFFRNRVYNKDFEPYGMKYHAMYIAGDGPGGIERPRIEYDLVAVPDGRTKFFFIAAPREKIVESILVMSFPEICKKNILYNDDYMLIIEVDLTSDKYINQTTIHLNGTFYISLSGHYKIFFLTCSDDLIVRGVADYKNAFGYLNGERIHHLTYYYFLVIAYSVIFSFWIIRLLTHKKV